jgi:hypothetical protein
MNDLRRKLALICGMLGSHHDGERAAAASKAHDIVQELGVTWEQILVLPEGKAEMAEVRRLARTLLKQPDLFSDFEIKFLKNLKHYTQPLSQKQRDLLAQLVERLEELAGGGRGMIKRFPFRQWGCLPLMVCYLDSLLVPDVSLVAKFLLDYCKEHGWPCDIGIAAIAKALKITQRPCRKRNRGHEGIRDCRCGRLYRHADVQLARPPQHGKAARSPQRRKCGMIFRQNWSRTPAQNSEETA